MKVKRMIAIEREIFDEMMIYLIRENQDFIKTLKDDNLRVRNKEKKVRFQLYIDLDLYETLGKSKTHKIERLLEKIIYDYKTGKMNFNVSLIE